MSNFAWVTLTTNDTYSLGALVLAHSLRRANTKYQLAVLITPGVSESMRQKLKDVYNVVQEVNVMDSQDSANLALLARPELGITFTKLHCWRLAQYEKCVFLDSDTLVLQNCDELFEREEFSAAPDVSWPDCFNSGVFVFKPNQETFDKIVEFALKNGSFDGGDQGLLNQYFADWATQDITKRLPFLYNVTAYASYCYLPAFKQFRDQIKILHFAGKMKPWLIQYNSQSKTPCVPSDYSHATDLIQLWWNIFFDNVHANLNTQMRYSLATMMPWQASYDDTRQAPQQEMHHNHNQHNENQYNLQFKHYQEQHTNTKIEFHDPWEDYYRKEQAKEEEETTIRNKKEEEEQFYKEEEEKQFYKEEEHEHNLEYRNEEEVKRNEPEAKSETLSNFVIVETEQSDDKANDNETINVSKKQVMTITLETISLTECQACASLNIETFSHESNKDFVESESSFHNPEQETQAEAGLAGALSQLRLGEPRTAEQDEYEHMMRRQCWEAGQVDYTGRDSFDNILKKITETLETKPEDKTEMITSADIQDGKVEYDSKTGASTTYKVIEGGYEMITTAPQPNGTIKTSTRTFWDPKPCSEEDMRKEQENKKLVKTRMNKEIRIDERTTMLTRAIEGGYEEVYTTVNEDGSRSMKTKTFFDSVPEGTPFPQQAQLPAQQVAQPKPGSKKTITRKSSVESTDSTDSRKIVQKSNTNQQHSSIHETRSVSQNTTITENNRTVRKNSLQTEQSIKSVTSSNVTDGKDSNKTTKKTKKTKASAPPPPADFLQNDTTTVATKRVPGGMEYVYSTQLDSGKTITTSKTVYEEEETELTEEEIRQYQKTLRDAEKHKNVTTTKKLRSESGTKKVVPSENPGDVTTVETIKIVGGTEYHYTTVTSEGVVKKAVKTVYDPVPCSNPDDTEEEEIIEEYEEEIIEPGEKNIRTIETIKSLPHKFEEEVTITHEKKEKKTKRSMVMSN